MIHIGFPLSIKENETRRALLPPQIARISNPERLIFERGYGKVLGISDSEYLEKGCKIGSRDKVLSSEVICDPKIGDSDFLGNLNSNQTIFGWIHAVQNSEVTEALVENKITAYAWENMYDRGKHVFWRNNELAGEAAVLHAFLCYGKVPYDTKVAVIGRGNTAKGAMKILEKLGAEVVQYTRRTENRLHNDLPQYDVIVNCLLWDVFRTDHIIYNTDLKRMKKNSLIIDVSCDKDGAIESSMPTTLENPTYTIDSVMHYAVDHTPTIFHRTFSEYNSNLIVPYINQLLKDSPDKVLADSCIIYKGRILDPEILQFQKEEVI